jgi:5'-3' exonuclease
LPLHLQAKPSNFLPHLCISEFLTLSMEKKKYYYLTVSLLRREMNQEVEEEVQYSYQAGWKLVEALEDMGHVHILPSNV